MPGEEAPIAVGEVEELTRLGYIADPDALPIERTEHRPANNPGSIGLQRTTTR